MKKKLNFKDFHWVQWIIISWDDEKRGTFLLSAFDHPKKLYRCDNWRHEKRRKRIFLLNVKKKWKWIILQSKCMNCGNGADKQTKLNRATHANEIERLLFSFLNSFSPSSLSIFISIFCVRHYGNSDDKNTKWKRIANVDKGKYNIC